MFPKVYSQSSNQNEPLKREVRSCPFSAQALYSEPIVYKSYMIWPPFSVWPTLLPLSLLFYYTDILAFQWHTDIEHDTYTLALLFPQTSIYFLIFVQIHRFFPNIFIYLFLAAVVLRCCVWLSLVAASRGYSLLWCAGFSL